jgi:hypothetical protein
MRPLPHLWKSPSRDSPEQACAVCAVCVCVCVCVCVYVCVCVCVCVCVFEIDEKMIRVVSL